jgi:hypothetical protein
MIIGPVWIESTTWWGSMKMSPGARCAPEVNFTPTLTLGRVGRPCPDAAAAVDALTPTTAAAAAAAASKPRVLISLSLLYIWQGKASRRAAAGTVRSDLFSDQNVNVTVYVWAAGVNTLF